MKNLPANISCTVAQNSKSNFSSAYAATTGRIVSLSISLVHLIGGINCNPEGAIGLEAISHLGPTVNLRLLNIGATSTTNLVATLQPSANVLAPSGPQVYGAISPNDTAGRDFTFTANGNSGDLITLTLQLQDGPTNLGNVTYSFTLGSNTPCAGAPRISTSTVLSCSNGNTVATIQNLDDIRG